jgi:hypothetical protein
MPLAKVATKFGNLIFSKVKSKWGRWIHIRGRGPIFITFEKASTPVNILHEAPTDYAFDAPAAHAELIKKTMQTSLNELPVPMKGQVHKASLRVSIERHPEVTSRTHPVRLLGSYDQEEGKDLFIQYILHPSLKDFDTFKVFWTPVRKNKLRGYVAHEGAHGLYQALPRIMGKRKHDAWVYS